MKQTLRAAGVLARTAFSADPRRALVVALLYLASSLSMTLGPLWLKLLTNAALAANVREVLLIALATAITLTASSFLGWIALDSNQVLEESTNVLLDEQVARISLGIPGIEHHERPDYQNEMNLLRQGRFAMGFALNSFLNTVALLIRAAITLVLLASIHPLLLLLPVFAFGLWASNRKAESLRQQALEATVENERRIKHLLDISTSAETSKELHVFGLRREILERHERLWAQLEHTRTRAATRGTALKVAGWTVFALGYAGAIAFVIRLALQGAATPGDVLMALGLAAQIYGYVSGGAALISWVFQTLRSVSRYLWLSDYAEAASAAPRDPVPVPNRLERGIDLENVSFRYPGTDRVVLSDVNLNIPAGTTVAIVGENGAGKSTLVKLLCRFYEPTEGRILIDGTDIKRFDIEQWRSHISAGFQDFARFELLARETVGVGYLPKIESVPAVVGALARAGAGELPSTLPAGLETQLGREWEGGTELSGGQWQKLALGRAMMRERPLLLILDEPTASLDAETEHSLFERYTEAADRTSKESGTITILVSHRFSTVSMADLILVVDNGRIVETGSHQELAAANGLYAELYGLQARAYR